MASIVLLSLGSRGGRKRRRDHLQQGRVQVFSAIVADKASLRRVPGCATTSAWIRSADVWNSGALRRS